MIKIYTRSDNKRALGYTEGDYGLVTVFEENHPKFTKNLFARKLKKYWEFERLNNFKNLEYNLTNTFKDIDRNLKKISKKQRLDCTISAITILISKGYFVVYVTGDCDMRYLDEYRIRNYGRFKYINPYGHLDIDEEKSDSCVHLKDNTKYFLMTKGVLDSLDEEALEERYFCDSEETADLIYSKALREGRPNPSLAVVEYA